jgi:hypothetical protein
LASGCVPHDDPAALGLVTSDAVAEIDALHRSYADLLSRVALESLDDVYAQDAVWDHPSVGRLCGLQAIRTSLAGELERLDFFVMVSHGGPTVAVEDRATSRCYVSEWLREPGDLSQHLIGVYEDEIVRGHDGWRYQQRRYTPIYRERIQASVGDTFRPDQAGG